jgi:hypothetical protein
MTKISTPAPFTENQKRVLAYMHKLNANVLTIGRDETFRWLWKADVRENPKDADAFVAFRTDINWNEFN